MEFGRNGYFGVYVFLYVVEVKEYELGYVYFFSMEEGFVRDLKFIISFVILFFV